MATYSFYNYVNSMGYLSSLGAIGYTEANYVAQIMDPCVYTNDNGTIGDVDRNSSPKECKDTGGTWVPPGWTYTVDKNGNVNQFAPQPTLTQQLCRAAAWSGGVLTAMGFGARAAAGGTAVYSIITGSEVVLLEGTPIGVPLAVIGGSIWATQRLVCD
jgi:hypothetical protein